MEVKFVKRVACAVATIFFEILGEYVWYYIEVTIFLSISDTLPSHLSCPQS